VSGRLLIYYFSSHNIAPQFRDTVNSVGLIPKRLPFTTSNTIVRSFRHAVALDERRAKFKANLWNRPNAKEKSLGIEGQKTKSEEDHARPRDIHKEANRKLRAMERQYSQHSGQETDIEEVCLAHAFPRGHFDDRALLPTGLVRRMPLR
jgi:uncharacterized protein (DUF2235 family)